jgi:hypothetical protein
LRIITFLLCLAALLSLTSCQPVAKSNNVFMLVDFDPVVPVKYKLVSERNTDVSLGGESAKSKSNPIYEKLEMVISYKSIGDPDPYGLTTVEATCHSAKVKRTAKNSPSKDVAEALTGKTYTFTVTPTGKIVDYTDMNKLAVEVGSKAVNTGSRQGSIKEPDMVSDFVALQWYLWDSVASSDQATAGLAPGTSWTTKQPIPLPVPLGFTRNTTYTLSEEIVDGMQGKVAINSVYAIGELGLENWPTIYSSRFRIKGTFGMLRNFRLTFVEGSGRQIFNVEKGLLESETQQFKVIVKADLLFPLAGTSPEFTVDQKISIELLEN